MIYNVCIHIQLLVIIIWANKIYAMENNTNTSKTMSEDDLKMKFGCKPSKEWDLIKIGKKEKILPNICLPSTYHANESPGDAYGEDLTSVTLFFADTKIIEINERKRTLTFSIWIWSFWHDPRIKVKWDGKQKTIRLPSITNTEYVAWYPFISYGVNDMIEIEPLLDPIIAKEFRLFPAEFANKIFRNEAFASNLTLIGTTPRWKLKIFCDFDFSRYPFDNQICSFRMVTERLNVTIVSPPNHSDRMPKMQTELSGFDIEREWITSIPKYDPIYQEKTSTFGFHFKLNRQIEPFFYKFYIPCIAIVIASFLSFVIPLNATPGRIALIVTQFLTLTNIFIHQMSESPSGSKLNHLGYFILSSLLFVFGTMVEFAFVLVDKQQKDWKSIGDSEKKTDTKVGRIHSKDREQQRLYNEKVVSSNEAVSKPSIFKNVPRSTKLDFIAFVIFNVCYIFFIIIYFISNI